VTTSGIPYFKPSIGQSEVSAVVEVLESGWLTSGATTKEFERAFADAVGASHAIAVNSCTAALHLGLVAANIGPGDEVIVPTMTFAATAEVVAYTGADLVLVDVDADTVCIDPAKVQEAITPRTRAVMPVHYGGQAAPMAEIIALAKAHGLWIVEDAAHAFPATYQGAPIGSIGDVTCFSFYANKTITTGEGGMLTTEDEEIADRIRLLSLHGLSRSAWRRWETRSAWDYDIVETGYKYNLTDIASAIGIEQLQRAQDLRSQRKVLAAEYDRLFDGSKIEPVVVSSPDDSAWHLYVIRVANRAVRDRVIERLQQAEIGSSVHYKPLHLHPQYEANFDRNSFPVASSLFDRIISLPLFPGLTTDQVRIVAETCIAALDS